MSNLINSRPKQALDRLAKDYPETWKIVDHYRAGRGKDLPMWPEWCFLPMAGSTQIVMDKGNIFSMSSPNDIARYAALSAWRVTQGIYRFDATVYEDVRNTCISGDIPCEILYKLPEWCVYIETPDMVIFGEVCHGSWVHLEWDTNTSRHELRILLDLESDLFPVILHIGNWTIEEAIFKALNVGKDTLNGDFGFLMSELNEIIESLKVNPKFENLDPFSVSSNIQADAISPILSLLIYICTQASDVTDGIKKPSFPKLTRAKGTLRMFPPNKVTTWNVGVRMGVALRKAYAAEAQESNFEQNVNSSKRAHIRRAHWHGFRSGPMKSGDGTLIDVSRRKFELRWLPPVAVNLIDYDQLPAVTRTVD